MPIFFISDLHLSDNHPETINLFCRFLEENKTRMEALYILGDLFDYWIGDDYETEASRTVIIELQKLNYEKIPVYLMHGNRDFLIGKKFIKQTGCQILPDPYFLYLYNTPTLLMHGDTLCTDDKAYLHFRKKVRNRLMQKLFLALPRRMREKTAKRYRDGSQKHTQTAPQEILDVNSFEVRRVMQHYGVMRLIHGHTHRSAIHAVDLNGQNAERIVLAAWHTQGQALICLPSGEVAMWDFD